MITLKILDGIACPVMACDSCHREITAGQAALLCWPADAEPEQGLVRAHALTLHAGACFTDAEQKVGEMMSETLTTAMADLVSNMEVSA